MSSDEYVLTASTESLVMATQTVPPGTTLADRVAAAVAGGYTGIGMRPRDRQEALAAGLSDADARAILDDHGVALVELEVHRGWGLTGEPAAEARQAEEKMYELADALGGRYMMAIAEIEGDLDDVAERFAGLCDRAAEHGLGVAIEFLPWTSIPDAGVAWDIVRLADRDNGGVLVDTLAPLPRGGRRRADPGHPTGADPQRAVRRCRRRCGRHAARGHDPPAPAAG